MMINNRNSKADKFIGFIFLSVVIMSVVTLLVVMGGGLVCCIWAMFNHFDVNMLLRGIEFIFMAPLPLLIASSFYKMYRKVARRTVLEQESSSDFERDQIMVDLTITKYLFVSTIVSTLLVILIELIYRFAHKETDELNYIVFIAGVGLLGVLIFYLKSIDRHIDHKLKEAKDSLQQRFIDHDFMIQKIDELDKDDQM